MTLSLTCILNGLHDSRQEDCGIIIYHNAVIGTYDMVTSDLQHLRLGAQAFGAELHH